MILLGLLLVAVGIGLYLAVNRVLGGVVIAVGLIFMVYPILEDADAEAAVAMLGARLPRLLRS
jgi:hypothetical protein